MSSAPTKRKKYKLTGPHKEKPWKCAKCGGQLYRIRRTMVNDPMCSVDRERKCLHCGHTLYTRETAR